MPIKDDWEFGDQYTHSDQNAVAGAVNANESAITGKADAVHSHAAGDVNSGTFAIGRIPTGTSSSTVCIGNDARLSNTRTPTDNTVTTAKIQDGAVTIAKMGTGRASCFANGAAASREFDVLNETQWDAVSSPVSGRIYLVFED